MDPLKKYSPSFERNIGPISEKLAEILPDGQGALLEIGSGSGQHTAHLAKLFPQIEFQPSELEAAALTSINAWTGEPSLSNVRMAITIDVTNPDWRVQANNFSAILAFNVIHYAPWRVTEKLFEHAPKYLRRDGKIIFYGPFKRAGKHTSDSNAEFEKWLKSKNFNFGVRNLDDVCAVAETNGFILDEAHPMPANNLMPVFVRR